MVIDIAMISTVARKKIIYFCLTSRLDIDPINTRAASVMPENSAAYARNHINQQ